MSMKHHWHELDQLLREADEAARFGKPRPNLAAVAREPGTETGTPDSVDPAPVVPLVKPEPQSGG